MLQCNGVEAEFRKHFGFPNAAERVKNGLPLLHRASGTVVRDYYSGDLQERTDILVSSLGNLENMLSKRDENGALVVDLSRLRGVLFDEAATLLDDSNLDSVNAVMSYIGERGPRQQRVSLGDFFFENIVKTLIFHSKSFHKSFRFHELLGI